MSKDLELIRSFLRIKAVDLEDELKSLAEKEEVLNIIFEKMVNIGYLYCYETAEKYNASVDFISERVLTEKEFNKIKHLWDTLKKH